MKKNILVLGGAGYIGSHFCHSVFELFNIIIVDNLETGHIEAVNQDMCKFYKGDIRDKDFLRKVFEENNIDAVVHFAANSLVGESMTNPLKYYDNNVYGTKVLLEIMNEFNVKKIVFSSTAAVYGNPTTIPITEDCFTNPTNPYGETKLAMEKMFKWADMAYGIKYVSLRYFNACGAFIKIGEAHNPETHLIPLVCKVALGQKDNIKVFGTDYDTNDGSCIRDYIHVLDLASAHKLALNYLFDGNESNIFNLGNNKGFSVLEIIEETKKITNKDFKVCFDKRRAGDPAILVASNQKALDILGWEPKYDLKSIILSALVWHSLNPNGYEKNDIKYLESLKTIQSLEPNWDDFGALSFTNKQILKAAFILKDLDIEPEVGPSRLEMIVLEYRNKGILLYILIDKDANVFYKEWPCDANYNDIEQVKLNEKDLIKQLNKKIKKFLK